MANLRCNLKKIADMKGLNVNQIAIAVNHRPQTVFDLANNKDIETARIPASLIANLCVYLNVTPNDLFTVVVEEISEV